MTSPHDNHLPTSGPPAPLAVAASLAAVEALVFLGLGVVEIASFQSDKATMGATTALFFFVYGVGLGICGWAVYRLRSWARAPIVVAQIIQLLVAWSFRGGDTTWLAVGLAIVAAIVLGGILHPQSIDALAEDH